MTHDDSVQWNAWIPVTSSLIVATEICLKLQGAVELVWAIKLHPVKDEIIVVWVRIHILYKEHLYKAENSQKIKNL